MIPGSIGPSLPYFTEQNTLRIQPCGRKQQDFILLKHYIIFLCVCVCTPVCVCAQASRILSTHQICWGTLYCLHTLETAQDTAMNTGVQMPPRDSDAVFSGDVPEVGLLGHRAGSILISSGSSTLFSRAPGAAHIPTNSARQLLFPHIVTSNWYLWSF